MKKLIFILSVIVSMPQISRAQIQLNPQAGVTFQNLSDPPEGVDYRGKAGFKIGADLRVGKILYFQPGVFFDRSATVIKFTDVDTFQTESNFIRTSLQLKALAGYKIINLEAFKLRVMAGPTYNVLISVDNKNSDQIKLNKDDYTKGSFNVDAGIGVDILMVTAEVGTSYGFSKAFKNNDVTINKSDSRYLSLYFTLGLVFGK